jgi:hypothetical protein
MTSVAVGMLFENKLPDGTTWKTHYSVLKYRKGDLSKEDVWTVGRILKNTKKKQ